MPSLREQETISAGAWCLVESYFLRSYCFLEKNIPKYRYKHLLQRFKSATTNDRNPKSRFQCSSNTYQVKASPTTKSPERLSKKKKNKITAQLLSNPRNMQALQMLKAALKISRYPIFCFQSGRMSFTWENSATQHLFPGLSCKDRYFTGDTQ